MSNDKRPDPRLNAPGYKPLRMAAEWAGAVRGEPFPFRYDTRTGRMTVDRERPEVSTYTVATARRPVVETVTFDVPAPGRITASFALPGTVASALFWEESAVEKFLLSYYASAAADDAAGFLGRVLGAWYGYPARVVQVCALAHLCGPGIPEDGTQLALENSVGFLCLEADGELYLLTLPEFEARYDIGLPRGTGGPLHVPDGRQPGWQVSSEVESIVTRESAEFVSGLRSRTVVFELEKNVLIPCVLPVDEWNGTPEVYVFTGMAELVRPDRPAPSQVTLWVRPVDGTEAVPRTLFSADPARLRPDSVFWTDGSVESFLLPYYSSVKGGDGWFFTAFLIGKWSGIIPPGASDRAKVRKVVDHFLERMVQAMEGEDDERVSHVYAMTHMPRSEYESSALEARTMLLAYGDANTGQGSHPLLNE